MKQHSFLSIVSQIGIVAGGASLMAASLVYVPSWVIILAMISFIVSVFVNYFTD